MIDVWIDALIHTPIIYLLPSSVHPSMHPSTFLPSIHPSTGQLSVLKCILRKMRSMNCYNYWVHYTVSLFYYEHVIETCWEFIWMKVNGVTTWETREENPIGPNYIFTKLLYSSFLPYRDRPSLHQYSCLFRHVEGALLSILTSCDLYGHVDDNYLWDSSWLSLSAYRSCVLEPSPLPAWFYFNHLCLMTCWNV